MKKISYIIFSLFILVVSYISFIKADSLFFKSNKNKALKNEDITITLDLNTITYDKYNVTITSSDNIRSLTTNDITINDIINDEISFDIDTLSMDIRLITFNYKVSESLNEGDSVIFTAKITEINETGENNSMTEYVIITIDKQKEEKPDNNNQNQDNTNNTRPNMNTTKRTNSYTRSSSSRTYSFSKQVETVTYNGSDNNYLNSLSIKGYKFNNSFSKEKSTYFVTVKNSTNKVVVNYKKSSSKSKVIITGNTNLKVGINKILVTVNAENGNSRVYRIYVTKEGNS